MYCSELMLRAVKAEVREYDVSLVGEDSVSSDGFRSAVLKGSI